MEIKNASYKETSVINIEGGDRYVRAGPSPLDWTPNEELVYTVPSDTGIVVYVTKLGSQEVANTISLPDTYKGNVTSLDVSPDGSNLLMGYNPKQGPYRSGVLLLDMQTLQVLLPTVVPSEANNIQGYIRSLAGLRTANG